MPSSAIGQFIIGESPIGGTPFPTASGTLKKIIRSYLYLQYSDDPDLTALVDAWNELAQGYLDWFNANPLGYYPGARGALLDWIGRGVYGYPRPYYPNASTPAEGAIGTVPLGKYPFAIDSFVAGTGGGYSATDDLYCRSLAWHVWRGDGRYFSVKWIKKRVQRFISQAFGLGDVDQTYQVSVKFGTFPNVTIGIIDGDPVAFDPNVLNAVESGIRAGLLETPFQFVFNVVALKIYELTADDGSTLLTADDGSTVLTNA